MPLRYNNSLILLVKWPRGKYVVAIEDPFMNEIELYIDTDFYAVSRTKKLLVRE